MNSLTSKHNPLTHLLLSFCSTSSRTLYITRFSTSSPSSPSSSSAHQTYWSFSRRYDEESRNVRVSVWWDIENCGVPSGSNVFRISQSIVAAVRSNGIKGPVQISAFGDVLCLTKANQEALSVTGINLIHIPNGGKNSADRSLVVDLMHWVTQNPPPAHVFLISSDRDFAGLLHRLRMNNYNILLAGKEGKLTPGVLCSAATIMWHWDELSKGENLSGRHFNQPPDCPFNSWYGHYKGPLEDPYAVPLLQNNSKAYDSTNIEQSSGIQHCPKNVLKHIYDIVNSYPNGLSITELRSHLDCKVTIDKNYYGYKKFSSLLFAMPQIVKVRDRAYGQYLILPVSHKFPEAVELDDSFAVSISENEKKAVKVTPKAPITIMTNVEPVLAVIDHGVAKESSAKEQVEETPEKVLDGSSRNMQVASAETEGKGAVYAQIAKKSPVPATKEQNPKSQMGVFKRLWTKWFSRSVGVSGVEKTCPNIPDKFHASGGSTEKSTSGELVAKSPNEHEIHDQTHCSSSSEFNVDAKSDKIPEFEVSPGFVQETIGWSKSLRNESLVKNPTEELKEEQTLIDGSTKHDNAPLSKRHDFFFKDTFWRAFEAFLRTYKGSDIVLTSISREQFAKRLKTDGPLSLRSLLESDLLDLVDQLISEKRWIKEFPTQIPRFGMFLPPVKRSASPQPPDSNGISSIMQKKPSEKTRSEILADCQKLLDELLQQHPEGFYTGSFKKKFLEKYGYSLDYKKLGYSKLVSILQIMPRVKVDQTCVYSDNVVHAPGTPSLGSKKCSSCSEPLSKVEDDDSQWEELGPVANSHTIEEEYKPPMVDDDELSDPEEETSSSSSQGKEEGQAGKRVINKEDSSLLQILNSWNTIEESNLEGLVDCSKDELGVESSFANSSARKQRSLKRYTFVSNSLESGKDKLIDGILGSLKKSRESRMQS